MRHYRFVLRHTIKGKNYDQHFETKERGEDAGDKLWHSYLKEDQDRLESLYLFDWQTRKTLKVWKKLGIERTEDD